MSWRDRIGDYKFSLLLVSLLAFVLLPILFGDPSTSPRLAGYGFLFVLFFGGYAVLKQRRAFVISIGLAGLAGALQIASLAQGPEYFARVRVALFAASLLFTAALIIADVLKAEAVTWDKIQGALCAYLLIGVAWGLLYEWVAIGDPQAFSGAVARESDYVGAPMIYYSFVTLTTLGYGDIAPVSHSARTLSWLQAAFGQIYLTVLVARLVGLHLTHTRRR